jgi:hypothetical protein
LTVPFTVTLGHGAISGNMTFPETVLVSSGAVSVSATITGGTGAYAGYTNSTVTASGTITGSVLSGGTLSFSVSGTVDAPPAIHVAAIILRTDGSGAYGSGASSYDILGPTGTSLGYKTVAAKAGDLVELYGIGFGRPIPPCPPGRYIPALPG